MQGQSMKSTAVSIRADDIFLRAWNALAKHKGVPTADLTREAIEKQFGEEMEPFIVFFYLY
jgi:predicted DNA-binding protein